MFTFSGELESKQTPDTAKIKAAASRVETILTAVALKAEAFKAEASANSEVGGQVRNSPTNAIVAERQE